MSGSASPRFFDLLEELPRGECPICTLVIRQVIRFLESVNYESAADPGFQELMVASHGWCDVHVEWWIARANVLATATLYASILKSLGEQIERAPGPRASRLAGWLGGDSEPGGSLPASGVCPACIESQSVERDLLRALLNALSDDRFATAYSASIGVCVPHVSALLCLDPPADIRSIVRERALATAREFRRDLSTIIRHHDYRFQSEPIGAERGAQNRAARWVAGTISPRHSRGGS